jgi:RNA polymerase sigma factor (sigma-70 family)
MLESEPVGSPRAGDPFSDALVAELPRLVGLANRLVRDADQAEDCAQETIIGAWRRRDQLRERKALSAWLRRSLVNRIIDRARAHHEELDIDAVETDWKDDRYSVAPERVLERAELRDELQDGLARLPVIYRVPVVLHVRGIAGNEAAAAEGPDDAGERIGGERRAATGEPRAAAPLLARPPACLRVPRRRARRCDPLGGRGAPA